MKTNRRTVIRSLVGGSLLLPGIVSELLAQDADPLAPRDPHFRPRAKRVIFLHMSGGASHIETFDYKPRLFADHNKPVKLPPHIQRVLGRDKATATTYLNGPKWPFRQHGQSGLWISELFPHIARCADELCLIRSMHNDHLNHVEATLGIHTGSVMFPRPSIGAWVSYGLGTENLNLPSYIVLAPELTYGGRQVWSSDFLPGCHQGTHVTPGPDPMPNLRRRQPATDLQEMELGLAQAFSRRHLARRPGDPNLTARLRSFETAFGMQAAAPEAFDVSRETDATLQLYGLPRGGNSGFAWQCLVARRLAERGVRFIELIDSGSSLSRNWDAHSNMDSHIGLARNVDQPIAGLIKDLKLRGMLDDTLVVWTTEFGRAPFSLHRETQGRDHHSSVFTSWMAGGGVKGGLSHGQSDEHGIDVAEDGVHVHDFHATILHLLGLDHERLTYRHAGRDFRLTDVHGNVVKEIIA
ncbi:sulfatase [Verrucomicrobiota bacterium]|nr:sulfatase [Verrucomicrobiota bacterium]